MTESDSESKAELGPEPPRISWRYRLVSIGAALFIIVLPDILLRFACGGFAFLLYLLWGGLGAWVGKKLHGRVMGKGRLAGFIRGLARLCAILTLLGMVFLTWLPTRWDLRCSWKNCGRAMGPGLLVSPYPVSPPTCQAWLRCVNQYPYSKRVYNKALKRIEAQGCPAP